MIGSTELAAAIEAAISAADRPFRMERAAAASGGCSHRAWILEGGGSRYFAKINDISQEDNFAAEADGLAALAAAGVRVPSPLCRGIAGAQAFLVLEYLDLGRTGDPAALARALVAVHSVHHEHYGWHRDNYIGASPQRNRRCGSWADFWGETRLVPQLELAGRNRLGRTLAQKGERLIAAVPELLGGHMPAAALLHGDLWGGNSGFLADGTPVLFDPAVYCGDREADVAMTELFGGFPPSFYSAYREAAPLAPGYSVRKTLYNLYHVLNHANIFGGAYAGQAERMMEQLLAEAG
jgi:protein-ribulosamine 3-kinase